ncbi:Uncharacterised protein [uncultured Roseburia sp.]|uniref:Uncharacterized protein n=1 Tax=Brotonthovivens ammoniilytica TaxID=2981725 RepID=A0ABT2TMA9_9FIRM|nr:hypothetical protein [Brotonthovivens ammoniilytica]MCU6762644.1 hypothetical protein [Brotonthovivens ammoniilytica]SCI78487.1 Uncharacterised protein [uncultured Roseburia sp.]
MYLAFIMFGAYEKPPVSEQWIQEVFANKADIIVVYSVAFYKVLGNDRGVIGVEKDNISKKV